MTKKTVFNDNQTLVNPPFWWIAAKLTWVKAAWSGTELKGKNEWILAIFDFLRKVLTGSINKLDIDQVVVIK